jgi:peptidoglycan/xylan/chitin deacetylase (PgdA/CDA1 family)
VALTFDDGPGPWTADVAGALEEHGCHGTFFLLGPAVEREPTLVAALAHAGHELGNHLWSHRDAATLSRSELRDEIDRTSEAVREAAAVTPTLLRPPYCSEPKRVASAAARGATDFIVLRSVDPADWQATSAQAVVDAVLAAVEPGAIVCLHDGVAPGNTGTTSRAVTAEAVTALVPALLERGLRPTTVSELLR